MYTFVVAIGYGKHWLFIFENLDQKPGLKYKKVLQNFITGKHIILEVQAARLDFQGFHAIKVYSLTLHL